MSPDDRRAGEYRCRVPLYFLSSPLQERRRLTSDIVLAPLVPEEAARAHAALCLEHEMLPRYRLEVLVDNVGQSPERAYDTGAAAIHRAMALLAVATGALPEWPEPVVDQYVLPPGHWAWQSNVGEEWFSYPPPKHSGGSRPHVMPSAAASVLPAMVGDRYWVDEAGLNRWQQMLASFPGPEQERQLHLAVSYLYEALALIARDAVTAFLHASIAYEALLGDSRAELSLRLALRGSHLVGHDAEQRATVFDNLRKAYDGRSKLVHEGRFPAVADLLSLVHFLLAAVPAFAHLTAVAGGRKGALALLDKCAVNRVDEIIALDAAGWWNRAE